MLFQSYTACRPAELVDGTKSRGGKDPMLDDEDDEDSGTELSADRSHMTKLSPEIQMILPRKEDKPEEFESEPGDPVFSEVDAFDSNDTSDTDEDDAENSDDGGPNILGNNVKMGGTQASLPCKGAGSNALGEEQLRQEWKLLCLPYVAIVHAEKKANTNNIPGEAIYQGEERCP
ncbi:hypothetical protein E5D57_013196 [Metarhizium anisopliae]|nr:hypothetical protein E5D57_013196 [Metarhizium anisopliae]